MPFMVHEHCVEESIHCLLDQIEYLGSVSVTQSPNSHKVGYSYNHKLLCGICNHKELVSKQSQPERLNFIKCHNSHTMLYGKGKTLADLRYLAKGQLCNGMANTTFRGSVCLCILML